MKKITLGAFIGLAIIVVVVSPVLAQTIPLFERNLNLGTNGEDVRSLQILLNKDIDTRIASSGPGSPGQETFYFGPLTKKAVIKFQEKYSQEILSPLGLNSGTGFIGRTTRQKLNLVSNRLEFFSKEKEKKISGLAVDTLASAIFGRNLKLGITGRDVEWLQILLNKDIDTRIASSGPGSPGQETFYFGPLTKKAVIRFQEKYSQEILSPLGLNSGTGFIGRTTRQRLNLILDKLRATTEGQGEQGKQEKQELAPVSEKTPTSESGLTVSLADSLSDVDLVAGQALAPLAEIIFTNNDNKEIKITSLKFKRTGVSSNSTLSNIYLFEGAKRLTEGVTPLATSVIPFNVSNGIITIPAGGSKTITIKSNLSANSNTELVGVSINSADDIISDASSVKGDFPINGRLTTIGSVTLAEADFSSSTTPATNSSVVPQDQYVVWQNTVNIPVAIVNLNRITLTQEGTIFNSDLKNFRLYINGVQVGTTIASLDADGRVTFDLTDSAKKLEIGYSTIKVLADITGGSSRTFKFSLESAADVGFVDANYGINILATAATAAFTARASGTQTVSAGTVTITEKSGGPIDVVNGVSAETIGEFVLTAGGGERVRIQTLTVEIIWTNNDSDGTSVGSLRDGIILVNGNQVGRVTSLDVDQTSSDSSGTTFSFGSLLTLEPNEQATLQVQADIYDNDGTNSLETSDTLKVNILAGSGNAKGLSSNAAISVPVSAVASHTVEVEQGELDLAKYAGFINKTMAVPVTNTKLAQFSLMSSKEDIDLDTIIINLATVTDAVDASDDLNNLYVVFDGNSTDIKAAVVDGDNTFTINHRLEKHTVLDISVYADVALSAYSSGTADTIIARARVSGVSAESGASAVAPTSSTYTSGQTITFDRSESGDLITRLGGDTPAGRIAAGSTPEEIAAGNPRAHVGAKYEFVAVEDNFLLKKIKIELDDYTSVSGVDVGGAVLYAVLKDGENIVIDKNGNQAKEEFGAGTGGDLDEVEFTGLEIFIPANTSKTLTFELLLAVLDSDGSSYSSQANLELQIKEIKYENSLGEEIEDSDPGGEPKGKDLYVYKSIPYFSSIDISENKIYNGTSTNLYSFKVAADYAGPISLKQLKLALNWDNNNSSTLVLDTFRLKRDLQEITNQVTIQDIYGASLESTTNTATPSHSAVVFTFGTEETIPAGEERTYNIYARPTGFQYKDSNGADTLAINLKGGADESAHNTTKRYLVNNSTTGLFELHTTNSGNGTAYDLIWSDRSAVRHSYSADNAYPDWANSYLMINLPLDAKFWHGQ